MLYAWCLFLARLAPKCLSNNALALVASPGHDKFELLEANEEIFKL